MTIPLSSPSVFNNADNLKLFVFVSFPLCCALLQSNLDILVHSCSVNKVTLNISKCPPLKFSRTSFSYSHCELGNFQFALTISLIYHHPKSSLICGHFRQFCLLIIFDLRICFIPNGYSSFLSWVVSVRISDPRKIYFAVNRPLRRYGTPLYPQKGKTLSISKWLLWP